MPATHGHPLGPNRVSSDSLRSLKSPNSRPMRRPSNGTPLADSGKTMRHLPPLLLIGLLASACGPPATSPPPAGPAHSASESTNAKAATTNAFVTASSEGDATRIDPFGLLSFSAEDSDRVGRCEEKLHDGKTDVKSEKAVDAFLKKHTECATLLRVGDQFNIVRGLDNDGRDDLKQLSIDLFSSTQPACSNAPVQEGLRYRVQRANGSIVCTPVENAPTTWRGGKTACPERAVSSLKLYGVAGENVEPFVTFRFRGPQFELVSQQCVSYNAGQKQNRVSTSELVLRGQMGPQPTKKVSSILDRRDVQPVSTATVLRRPLGVAEGAQ